ncbi:MAG: hypothetical protein Q9160_004948, partial [Pyrenula sp. 1 TL-2023]
ISTQEGEWPRIIEGSPMVEGLSAEAWTFAPHAATSQVLTRVWSDPHWETGKRKLTGTLSGQAVSEAAVVRTVCSPEIQNTSNDTHTVKLPVLSEYEVWSHGNESEGESRSVQLPRSLWTNSNASLINTPYVTTAFIQLDLDMAAVTTGVLIVGRRRRSGDRFLLSCSVDARWNHALHVMTKSSDYGIGNSGNPISVKLRGRNKQDDLRNRTLPINDGNWRHISMDKYWLEGAIGYQTLYNGGYQPHAASDQKPFTRTTALGMLIMTRQGDTVKSKADLGDWLRFKPAIESVISTVFADAISRTGSPRQQLSPTIPIDSVTRCGLVPGSSRYNFCPGPPGKSKDDWTLLKFQGLTTGYAYKASRPTDYLSLAILALYVVIALLHTIFCHLSHRTFSRWNNIEELTLLAKKSKPMIGAVERAANPDNPSCALSLDGNDQSSRLDRQKEAKSKGGNDNHVAADNHLSISCLSAMGLRRRIRSIPQLGRSSENDASKHKETSFENNPKRLQLLLGDDDGKKSDAIRPGVAYSQC